MTARLAPWALRTRDLLLELSTSDLRVRYGRGRMRFVKWVLDPIAALGVFLLFVILVIDMGTEATALSLACAIVPFQLVMATIINAVSAVQVRKQILLNMRFPGMLIPVASVVTESVAFVATLMLLPILMAAYGIAPTWAALWLPLALAATVVLALAIAYPSTLFGIWYPELGVFAASFARASFFLAPGLITLDQITGFARTILPINPLTGLFETYRDALLYGQSPAAWQLLIPLAAAALIVAASLPLYRREQMRLAKLVG